MQLRFKASGRGRAVILLHGMLGSSDNWHAIMLGLADKFQVIAPDQRNHGHSPHSDEMNYPIVAADLEGFFAAQKIESADVIGHSMGGKAAMQFALMFPHRVGKLIVADIAPRAYAPAYEAVFAALLSLDLKSFSSRQEIEDALAPEISSLSQRRFLLKNLGRDAGGGFVWKINLRGIAQNYARLREPVSAARPFAKPVLFIRGGKSNYVTGEDEPLIRLMFPQANIRTIESAGHWLHADQAEEFLRLVLNFLEPV